MKNPIIYSYKFEDGKIFRQIELPTADVQFPDNTEKYLGIAKTLLLARIKHCLTELEFAINKKIACYVYNNPNFIYLGKDKPLFNVISYQRMEEALKQKPLEWDVYIWASIMKQAFVDKIDDYNAFVWFGEVSNGLEIFIPKNLDVPIKE